MSKLAANNARKGRTAKYAAAAAAVEQIEQIEVKRTAIDASDTNNTAEKLSAVLKDESVDSNSTEMQDAIKDYITQDEQTVQIEVKAETAQEMIARVKAEMEKLKQEREEFNVLRAKQVEELKVKREAEKLLAALEAEKQAFEADKNKSIDIDEEETENSDYS